MEDRGASGRGLLCIGGSEGTPSASSARDRRAHTRHFEQAGFCAAYGSPFTGALPAPVEDLRAGGPTPLWWRAANPLADALALRLAGALHAAALTGRDPALAALSARGRTGAWRGVARRACLCRARSDWVAPLSTPPQTNETRRAIAARGLSGVRADWAGRRYAGDRRQRGLNQWDRFQCWLLGWGDDSPVIDTDWQRAAALVRTVRHRAGCDLNPLDPRQGARLRLKSISGRSARAPGAL